MWSLGKVIQHLAEMEAIFTLVGNVMSLQV